MITIYDVAKAAKVSPKTAARILAGARGRPYNEATVLAAAKKLGYVRNQQAAALRSGKSNLIGLIVPDIGNPFYPAFLQTIHDIAAAQSYQILLSSTFGSLKEEVHALRMFEMNQVEGIILNASEGEPDDECDLMLERFKKRGVPVILAGRPARRLEADEIVVRNTDAIKRAVAYLAKTGHTRLGFISGHETNFAARERLKGFREGVKAGGLVTDDRWISHGSFAAESGLQQTLKILGQSDRPTAIVAVNDVLAIGAIRACAELRLKVPEQVAITGFDDIPMAQLTTPALTTLRQPQDRIARDCVNLLIQRIASKDLAHPRRLVYEAELVIRESA